MLDKVKELLCKSYPNATKDIGDYSNKERNFYLAGMFGQNIIYAIIGSVLQVFYTDVPHHPYPRGKHYNGCFQSMGRNKRYHYGYCC